MSCAISIACDTERVCHVLVPLHMRLNAYHGSVACDVERICQMLVSLHVY